MNKSTALRVIASSVFLILFNALFFILGGSQRATSVWISYGFIHGAYVMLLATPLLVRKGKSASVFGFAVGAISSVYFLGELVAGASVVVASPKSHKAALLVQLCLAGAYILTLSWHLSANQQTGRDEEERQYGIDYVKKAASEARSIIDETVSGHARRAVESVYDALNACPVKTHPDVSSLELRILDAVANLRSEVRGNSEGRITAQSVALLRLIEERNRQLKLRHQ